MLLLVNKLLLNKQYTATPIKSATIDKITLLLRLLVIYTLTLNSSQDYYIIKLHSGDIFFNFYVK